jgi:hypothetical protein
MGCDEGDGRFLKRGPLLDVGSRWTRKLWREQATDVGCYYTCVILSSMDMLGAEDDDDEEEIEGNPRRVFFYLSSDC